LEAARWVEAVMRRYKPELIPLLKIVGGRIVIPEPPLVGIRPIIDIKEEKPKTLEVYEYIDGSFTLEMELMPISSEDARELTFALNYAGNAFGMGAWHNVSLVSVCQGLLRSAIQSPTHEAS